MVSFIYNEGAYTATYFLVHHNILSSNSLINLTVGWSKRVYVAPLYVVSYYYKVP